MHLQKQEQWAEPATDTKGVILPFTAIQRNMLALVGGKGANLGEMVGAELPVPPGFCITTTAYEQVAAQGGLEALLEAQAGLTETPEQLAELARSAQERMQKADVPDDIAASITEAYRLLGSGEPIPVAVRSSATAEDLPFASFAGQQDTYLNIVGVEAVVEAVRRCWASLWTERAVSYRASLGLDQRRVQLAVVVQRMVEAEVAGVLFTANPVTGRRRQAVIDAHPGLGEAVVSGMTNPDHFVVNTASEEIVERRIGDKRLVIRGSAGGGTTRMANGDGGAAPCLSDAQIRELARLGARVEAHYGAPQDTEWAIDAEGKLWLTQTRPITTLYPLPANAPANDAELRVYLSLNVFQGVLRPLTPMGIAAFRLIGSTVASLFDIQIPDRLRGPAILVESGSRLFFDVTAALRVKPGRRLLLAAMGFAEARSGVLLQQLISDPRLSLKPLPRWRALRAFGSLAAKMRAPLAIPQIVFNPARGVERMQQFRAELETLQATLAENAPADPTERLLMLEQIIPERARKLFLFFPLILISGLGSLGLASKLLKGLATPDELQIVVRALPHNPTTEMDLDLWTLSRQVAADAAAVEAIRAATPEQLSQAYRAGTLPPVLQQRLTEFLSHYGHRGVAEIDLGLPRWREDPAHILGVLANYLHIPSEGTANTNQTDQQPLRFPHSALIDPHAQFQRGAQEAEAMANELVRRARHKGRVRGLLVRFFLKRARELAGLREMPKFCLVLLLSSIREILQSIGKDLADAERLENGADIFFLTLQEAHAALAGADMRERVRERQADYEHELLRRHVPRVLLSDGTEPAPVAEESGAAQNGLRGTPASPGRITGVARVILDPNGAHLEPGEILVAPSTDPGWTPLFLTAGGLVMEMGGAISHGAVVAREYGIPAVVGVARATELIISGQTITIDGAAGTISIKETAE